MEDAGEETRRLREIDPDDISLVQLTLRQYVYESTARLRIARGGTTPEELEIIFSVIEQGEMLIEDLGQRASETPTDAMGDSLVSLRAQAEALRNR